MINGIMSVIVIFLILTVGFWFSVKKRWPDNTTSVLSLIVVRISAPALAIVSISDRFNKELLHQSAFNVLIIMGYTSMLYLTGKLIARILKLTDGKKTVFIVSFTFSNTIFIGLPINAIVFGHEGLPYLFTFYIVTLVGFWSLGAYELASACPSHGKKFSVKRMFTPGLGGVIAGILLVQIDQRLPMVLDNSLRYLSNLTVPLSLLVIGANLAVFGKGFSKIRIDELLIIAGKFIISPLYLYLLLRFFGVTGLPFQVFLLTASMPCHMQTSILAEYYGVEGEYASRLVSISTLVSLITIPVYVTLLVP